MTPLATIDQLADVMERSIDDDNLDRVNALLDIASQRVRTFTGRTFTLTTETKRVKVRNGKIRLPQAPVVSVASIADMNANALTFVWYVGQTIDLTATPLNAFEIEPWRCSITAVDVTYTHGYTEIPADVVGIVCDMAAAALDAPSEEGGLQSETLGPYTYTRFSGVRLTQSMRDALANYMAPVGTAQIS